MKRLLLAILLFSSPVFANEFILILILLKGYKRLIQLENDLDCKVAYKKRNIYF